MEPEEISEKAEKERKRLLKENEAEKDSEKANRPRDFRPRHPESWKVFAEINPNRANAFVWIFLVLTPGIVFLSLYWLENIQWSLKVSLPLLGAFALRVTYFYFRKIIGFLEYRNWRKDLPFEIKGWDRLGSRKDFPKVTHWALNSTVKIFLKPNPLPSTKKLIEDALFLFTAEANKGFYTAGNIQSGFAGDIRHKWKTSADLFAEGSADPWVLSKLYISINKTMRSIQVKYPVIESIEVTFGNEFYQVKPVEESMT